jgi:dolichol-phosphate mannosyltransferase
MYRVWQRTGCDVVNGVKRKRGKESRLYGLLVRMFGILLSGSMHQNLMNASEFKLLGPRAISTLLACGDRHIFYRAIVKWIGLKQEDLEFDIAPEMRPSRHWRPGSLLRFATDGLVMFSDYPIRLILGLGMAVFILCIVLTIKMAFDLLYTAVPQGYSTLLVLILLNLACTMIGLGVIGLYVRSVLRQTLARPRAIVEEICFQGETKLEKGNFS